MIVLLVVFSLLVLIAGVVLWAGGGKLVFGEQGVGTVEAMPDSLAESLDAPTEALTLFSCHLGYGLGDTSVDAVQASEAIYDRLDRVIEEIAVSEADAALLQEVDFSSSRTGWIPQLHYMAAALGWGYVAAITTWECRYLPLPRSQAGRVRAGQGIISRLPLEHNSWQRFAQPRWGLFRPAAMFAPQDAVQVVDMRCGVRGVRLVQAQLASRHGSRHSGRQDELLAVMRRVGMPSCVVTGVGRRAAEVIGDGLGFQAEAGDVLLGSIWTRAEVRLLSPLSGVSDHAPVLVKLDL